MIKKNKDLEKLPFYLKIEKIIATKRI